MREYIKMGIGFTLGMVVAKTAIALFNEWGKEKLGVDDQPKEGK